MGLLGGLIDTVSPSNPKNPVNNCAFREKESEKEIKHKLLEIDYEEMQKTIPVTRNSIFNFTLMVVKKRALDISNFSKKSLYQFRKHALL